MKAVMHKTSALYFNELAAYLPNKVAIGGNFYALADTDPPLSRIGVCIDGHRWGRLGDIDDIVASIVAFVDNDIPTVLSLGRSGKGLLVQGTKKYSIDVKIDSGYLFQMRKIGNSIYGCGSLRQVWKFNHEMLKWVNIDAGVRTQRKKQQNPAFHSLDGISEQCIYAGGREGELFKFDGLTWTRLDSPTNKDITNIVAVAKEEIYICGKNGILFRGSEDLWEPIGIADSNESFWCLTYSGDTVFASTLHDVYLIRNGIAKALPKPKENFSFHKISACNGYLWATGGEGKIARWNGVEWIMFLWPDN